MFSFRASYSRHTLDWVRALLPLALIFVIAVYTEGYVKSMADFMSDNRSAGRYLLDIAGGELQTGVAMFVAGFEVISHSGFNLGWWSSLSVSVWTFLGSPALSRSYRETWTMTRGKFFEIRYSKSFRPFTSVLAFSTGILNFGLIPAVGARCIAYFWGSPQTFALGSCPMAAYIPLMAFFLSLSLAVALSGGAIILIITLLAIIIRTVTNRPRLDGSLVEERAHDSRRHEEPAKVGRL